MIENNNQAISLIAIFLFVPLVPLWAFGFFTRKKLMISEKRKGFYDDRELTDGGFKMEEIERNFESAEKDNLKVGYDKNTSIFCNGKKVA
ncbi:MAG: hypothetical protein KAI72_01715 [Candidatus Pacebacteria bacterium]|nr:hypothetical protein [Candidatus Paceibacterota bacterium]